MKHIVGCGTALGVSTSGAEKVLYGFHSDDASAPRIALEERLAEGLSLVMPGATAVP